MGQDQEGGDSSTNMQAGRDLVVVHQGATIEEMREIALAVYRANFLELRGVAEDVANARAEAITTAFLEQLEVRAPDALGSTADPDMQRAIFDAQKEYACSGDEDLETVLVDLLVDRASEKVRETRTIVLNEAITAAPKLTAKQRQAIAVCFIVRHALWIGTPTLDAFYDDYVKNNLVALSQGLPKKASAYQHIEYVGAGSVTASPVALMRILRHKSPGWFTRGATRDEIPQALQPRIDDVDLFMPCIRDASRLQLTAMDRSELEALIERIDEPGLQTPIEQTLELGMMTEEEIQEELLSRVPAVADLIEAWENSGLKSLSLTSVGIAIGHGYWRRVTGEEAPLSIWISD